jgi:MATE family multidrug resistance protein
VSALRGYKHAVVPMMISAISLWGVGLAGGYVIGLSDALDLSALGLHAPLGAPGFWAAATAGLAVAFAATVVYYFVVSAPRHAARERYDRTGIPKSLADT